MRPLVGTALAMGMAVRLAAQAPAPEAPLFTAASVKVNTSGSLRSTLDLQPGGRFTALNAFLLGLVALAYGDDGPLTPDRVIISSAWTDARSVLSAKFDILATAERDVPREELARALRPLLADRFRLVVHRETRSVPSYELVLARADGRMGPRLRPSLVDCTQSDGCGFQSFPGKAKGRVPIDDLARRVLPAGVGDGRPIVNKTPLTGVFDFELEWTPDEAASARRPDSPPAPPIDPNGPSFVTALREQLGLKLEARTGSIDVLVIDHAERPGPD